MMMSRLGCLSLLLLPVTTTGALLGVAYSALTGRRPSSQLLMVFGVVGLALLVAGLMRLVGQT